MYNVRILKRDHLSNELLPRNFSLSMIWLVQFISTQHTMKQSHFLLPFHSPFVLAQHAIQNILEKIHLIITWNRFGISSAFSHTSCLKLHVQCSLFNVSLLFGYYNNFNICIIRIFNKMRVMFVSSFISKRSLNLVQKQKCSHRCFICSNNSKSFSICFECNSKC